MAAPNGHIVALAIISCLLGLSARSEAAQYLGKFLGKLTELHHGVSGEVYAVDARTLHIKDFTYDGQGPAAYFFAGNSRAPGNAGFRIRDENGSPDVLRRYRKEGVTITLPEGKSLNSIKWFSVWCEEFEVNFGDVKIPRNFEYPRPQKIEGLRGVHGVSSDNVVIVDAQTLLVPNLSYDGEAPDAKFWVGRGSKPSPQGIRVPDENGKEIPLRRYDRKTVVLTLPGDLTVFDIGHFGIWCEAFTVDFGHVQIPQPANVPPSLKMLGVSPQKRPRTYQSDVSSSHQTPLVGGQVEATTYRPVSFFASRRNDLSPEQPSPSPSASAAHGLVNRDIYSRSFSRNTIPHYTPVQQVQSYQQNQQFYQPQATFNQPVVYNQLPHAQVYSQNVGQFRVPVPYVPFNSIQQQPRVNQLVYHQQLQNGPNQYLQKQTDLTHYHQFG